MRSRLDKTLRRFTERGTAVAPHKQPVAAPEDSFAGDFAKVKSAVIRPAFDALADWLRARGSGVEISDEPVGISMQVVPAGLGPSDRPAGGFPAFSVTVDRATRMVGLRSSNTRPGAAASRGDYALAQISNPLVEKELMKFVDEIAHEPVASTKGTRP